MFKWLFHILIFATSSGKYQNKEKPLKRQRKFGLGGLILSKVSSINKGCYTCQWLDSVDMHTYAKFDQIDGLTKFYYSAHMRFMQYLAFKASRRGQMALSCFLII